jgi:GNAT superfamily N-acetyltransferase
MINIELATLADFAAWLELAQEVEPLFGPMVTEPAFHEGLKQMISDGKAFCSRNPSADDGRRLQGGIVIAAEANEILWFAVTQASRGQGIGQALLAEALQHLDAGRPITVTTFADTVTAGLPARKLYQKFGFTDFQPGEVNPAGIPTVVMIRRPEKY